MIRHDLLEKLQNYFPTDSHEIQFKSRMIEFIKQHANCFERSLEIGHITASCWLINKDNTQALMMHHAKLDQWFQLGGHCDGNPNVLEVAIKEAQEESGIEHIMPVSDQIFDIDIHLIPQHKDVKAHDHYDVRFLLRVASDEDVVQNTESKELKWFGKDISQLPTDNPSIARMFKKWLSLRI